MCFYFGNCEDNELHINVQSFQKIFMNNMSGTNPARLTHLSVRADMSGRHTRQLGFGTPFAL